MQVMMILSTLVCSSYGQGWRTGWGLASRYGRLNRPYRIPIAEPEPEPEVFRTWTLSNPYRIPMAEPEPEPSQRRLSRRLISTKTQNLVRSKAQLTPAAAVAASTVLTALTASTASSGSISSTAPVINRKMNIIKLLEESFPSAKPTESTEYDEIFSVPPILNTWDIDTAQFDIVPAVPTDDTAIIVSADSDEKYSSSVSRQFSPVPAVPDITEEISRQPKKVLDSRNINIEDGVTKANETKVKDTDNCEEKCIEQFCLPQDDLSMLSKCENKCRNFCV